MLKKLCWVFVMALWPGLIGCSDKDCTELCEEAAEECDYSNAEEDACQDGCDLYEDFDDCSDELDEFVACYNDVDDICDETECEIVGSSFDCSGECASESEDLFECIVDYCIDNPNASECAELTG